MKKIPPPPPPCLFILSDPVADKGAGFVQILARRIEDTGGTAASAEAAMLKDVPAARFADPAEVAATIAFLASPAAGYVNGVSLAVDGGRTHCI